jgi:hypothetical protein
MQIFSSIRVSTYTGDVEELAKQYSEKFFRVRDDFSIKYSDARL